MIGTRELHRTQKQLDIKDALEKVHENLFFDDGSLISPYQLNLLIKRSLKGAGFTITRAGR